MYHYTGPRRAVCTAVTGPGARVCFSLFFVAVVAFFFFFLLLYPGRRIVVTVFHVDTTSAEPRCSSASNNHSIRACGKSTCWLPLNESERARARTPLCHRRRTIKSRSSRECTVTIGPHSIRINRLPVPRRTSWSAYCDIADLGIFHFGQSVPPQLSRDLDPVWCDRGVINSDR